MARRPHPAEGTAPVQPLALLAVADAGSIPDVTADTLLELAAALRDVDTIARRLAGCPNANPERWHAWAQVRWLDAIHAQAIAEEWRA